jgi:hypothetical protein
MMFSAFLAIDAQSTFGTVMKYRAAWAALALSTNV